MDELASERCRSVTSTEVDGILCSQDVLGLF